MIGSDPTPMRGATSVVIMFNSMRAGGSQTYALELASRLHEVGVATRIVAKSGVLKEDFLRQRSSITEVRWREGDAIIRPKISPRRMASELVTMPTLLKLRKLAASCDVMIASQPWPQYYASLVASSLPEWVRPRLISIFHGFTPVELPPVGGVKTLNSFQRHFTSTVEAQEQLRRVYGTRSTVLGNLFSAERYWGQAEPWQAPRHFIPGKIVTLSTLTPNKSPAVRAILRWLERTPDCTLAIIGDGTERPHLVDLVRGLRLEDRVTFLGQLNDPRSHIETAAAVVGVGRAAMEACSRGIPVIIGGEHGFAGPVTAQNFSALSAVNFTDRIPDRQPLDTMVFEGKLSQALNLQRGELALVAQLFRWVGSVDPLLEELGVDPSR